MSLMALAVAIYFLLRKEAFVNDKQRAFAALEDPNIRDFFVSGVSQDYLNSMLGATYDPASISAYLELGADPREQIIGFIRNFDDANKQYFDSLAKIKSLTSQLDDQDLPEVRRARISVLLEREIRRSENYYKWLTILRNNISNLNVLLDGYLENRVDRRGRYYLPFKREQMLEVLRWLLKDDQMERFDRFVQVENIYPDKFTFSQQKGKMADVIDYLREYWKDRQAAAEATLSDFLPKDLVKMTLKYGKKNRV